MNFIWRYPVKYLDEFRNPDIAKQLLDAIRHVTSKPWVIMEVCGGQTHAIIKNGLDQLLPDTIQLVHGPGCPVCVTPVEIIDKAIAIASQSDVTFTSFGDMLRVPGSRRDLLGVKSEGGDIRIVYSPLDAVRIARDNPRKKVVFFGIGFETTAPATAMAVKQAHHEGLPNFFLLAAHVLVVPAMIALLKSPDNRVQAYLAPGHVSAVIGEEGYQPICREYHVPVVITGFEPVDLLDGILAAVTQLESGEARVENRYLRAVSHQGNRKAQQLVNTVFEIVDRKWRGIGTIPQSGLRLSARYVSFDAELHFDISDLEVDEPSVCISGQVLQGLKKPVECAAFGKQCTPQTPLGATMVSSEGACAAYYAYHRTLSHVVCQE
jgi:hydrogenase expression/formation protein HypD